MTETATSMNDEPPLPKEKRKRFGINKNLIMLKLALFFLYGGSYSRDNHHFNLVSKTLLQQTRL